MHLHLEKLKCQCCTHNNYYYIRANEDIVNVCFAVANVVFATDTITFVLCRSSYAVYMKK
jgi:hypothetical protein